MTHRIGIDLGGSKIEGAVLAEDGQLLFRRRLDTPRGDYQGTLTAIDELVHILEQQVGDQCTIGIGTPGALSPTTGLLRNSNSTCLNGQPLGIDLTKQLDRPVRLANDADCFALSEASDGAAAGAASVFGVIIGTGTGGGLVINGQLLQGPNAIAGEWGHNPLPWPNPGETPGPACYCGKHGCIETFLSGPGLAHDHRSDDKPGPATIVQRAELGDPEANATMLRYENRMARSLASVINIVDPEVIVLGGGLSKIQRLYRNVPEKLPDYVFSDSVNTRLLPPLHGDSSGVRGAAWLWPT